METIKINLADDTTANTTTTISTEESAISVGFVDKTPCNWVIEETPVGISARNNKTGELFEGTIEEFNGKLK